MTEEQWREFGSLVKEFHSLRVPDELEQVMPREAFVPKQRALIDKLEKGVSSDDSKGAVTREFAETWGQFREMIHYLVERADALGAELQREDARLVLCHADMHTWNVMVQENGQFWLVDWDETMLALKERDLMFVIGGIGGDGIGELETRWFLDGYGTQDINERAMTYYRYAWAVQDIAAYGEQALFLPGLSEEARREGVEGLRNQFKRGGIVEIALRSDLILRKS
jgi:spectinomycin phosphotransferase